MDFVRYNTDHVQSNIISYPLQLYLIAPIIWIYRAPITTTGIS